MRLIGLTGKAGSGKDTAFLSIQQAVEQHQQLAVRRGFADSLKISAMNLFAPHCTMDEAIRWADDVKLLGTLTLTVAATDGDDGGQVAITGRQFFQRYGTEAHRDVFGPDFWVDALLPEGYESPVVPNWWKNFVANEGVWCDYAVITDVRFPNEAQRIKALGGEIWLIRRPGTDTGDIHSSESGLPDVFIDRVIDNNGDLDSFRRKIEALINNKESAA